MSLVGINAVRVLSAALSSAARERPDQGAPGTLADAFSYPRYWNRALLSALAARALARLGGKVPLEEAFDHSQRLARPPDRQMRQRRQPARHGCQQRRRPDPGQQIFGA